MPKETHVVKIQKIQKSTNNIKFIFDTSTS